MVKLRTILLSIMLYASTHLIVSCGGGNGGLGNSPIGDANSDLNFSNSDLHNQTKRRFSPVTGEPILYFSETGIENQTLIAPEIGQRVLNQSDGIVRTIYRHPDPSSLRVSHAIVSDSDHNFSFNGDGFITIAFENERLHQIRQYVDLLYIEQRDGRGGYAIRDRDYQDLQAWFILDADNETVDSTDLDIVVSGNSVDRMPVGEFTYAGTAIEGTIGETIPK